MKSVMRDLERAFFSYIILEPDRNSKGPRETEDVTPLKLSSVEMPMQMNRRHPPGGSWTPKKINGEFFEPENLFLHRRQ